MTMLMTNPTRQEYQGNLELNALYEKRDIQGALLLPTAHT